jgi:hypothetical protein
VSPGRKLARQLHDRLVDWEYEPAEGDHGLAVLTDSWKDWQLVVEPDGGVELHRRGRDAGHVQGLDAAELVAMVTCSVSRAGHTLPSYTRPAPGVPGGSLGLLSGNGSLH